MSDASPETTDDGRYIIAGGRRWRATDPGIPENLRTELVSELMRARRSVKDGTAGSRNDVHEAKIALGERGEEWWSEPTSQGLRQRITAAINALLRAREGKTVCPSDAARIVGGESWRQHMDAVRDVAWDRCDEGAWVVLQKGEPASRDARGPIRIGVGPKAARVEE